MAQPPLIANITRIVVIANPRSTRSERSDELVAALRSRVARLPVQVVRASEPERTRHELTAALQTGTPEHTLLVIAGGDGTAHCAVNALLHPETPPSVRKVACTAWPLGNGNDFFNSIHTAAVAARPLEAILSSALRTISVHPLEWRYQDAQGEHCRYALCYATVGASAGSTAIINQPEHRERRRHTPGLRGLWMDVREGARAMWFPQQFMVRGQGKAYRAMELQFNNGPIMTIRGRYPILLSDPGLFFSVVRPNHPFAVGLTTLRMGLGMPAGKRYTKSLQFHLESTAPIPAQADGEPFSLPPDVRFSIGPSAQSLTIWASKAA